MTEGTNAVNAKAGARIHRVKRMRTQAPHVGDTISSLHDLQIDPLTLPQAHHDRGAEDMGHHHQANGKEVEVNVMNDETQQISKGRNRTPAKEANKITSTYNTRAKGLRPSNKQNGTVHASSVSHLPSAPQGTQEAAVTGLKTPLSGSSAASENIQTLSNRRGKTNSVHEEEKKSMIGKFAYKAKKSDIRRTAPTLRSSPSMPNPQTSGVSVGTMTSLPFEAGDVDLSNAPADPIELAIWIAQQVKRFCVQERSSVETDNQISWSRLGSFPHVPQDRSRRNVTEPTFGPTMEPTERRSLQASRKREWREFHPNKSELDFETFYVGNKYGRLTQIDGVDILSDIHSRVSARAKKIYGSQYSSEKARYMDAESKKRLAKHHAKEGRAVFEFSDDASQALFPLAGEHSNSHLHAVGTLLFNSLFNVRILGPANCEAAEAFKCVIEDTEIHPELFTKALRIMANDSGTMSVINEGLAFYKNFREKSGSTLDTQSFSTRSTTTGTALSFTVSSTMQQPKIVTNPTPKVIAVDIDAIKAAQTATAILQENPVSVQYKTPYSNPVEPEIPKVDPYESPYANPYTSAVSNPDNYSSPYGILQNVDLPNVNSTHNVLQPNGIHHLETIGASHGRRSRGRKVRTKSKVTKKALPGASLDIDKLLALANGGSLAKDSDDDDTEEEMPHEGQGNIEQAPSGESPKLDEAVMNVVRLVGGDQAPALQSLLEKAKVSVNCVVPAVQSRAISELYGTIASRARFAYGSVPYNHQVQFGGAGAVHNGYIQDPVSSGFPPQTVMPPPNATANAPTLVRAKNREEARKIMTYGYPPLPGGQPGRK